jgi:hypothetical protein
MLKKTLGAGPDQKCVKTSNENAEILCVRRAASAVTIVISGFPRRTRRINVLASKIRRTIGKKLSVRFKIHMHGD